MNIFNYSVAILIRRDNPYLPRINLIIQDLLEFGLIDKWERESRINTRLRQLSNGIQIVSRSEATTTSESDVIGEFNIALFLPIPVGYGLATLAFVLERLNFYYFRTGNIVWRALDGFLSPQRHYNLREPAF